MLPLFRGRAGAFRALVGTTWQRWLPDGSLRGRFGTAIFWSFMGMFVARGFGLLAAVVTARILGQVGFGEFGIITSTLGMFSVLGGLGLGLTATKHVAEFRDSAPDSAGSVAGVTLLVATISSGALSVILFVFSPILAGRTLNAPHLSGALRLASAYLLLTGINGVQIGILSGFEAFKVIAQVNFVRGIVNLPLTIVGVRFYGLAGAISTLLILELITVSINRLLIKRLSRKLRIPILYRGNWAHVKILWNFSLPGFLSSVLSVASVWLVNALLVNRLNGYAEMGLLSAATQWQSVAIVVPSILSTVGVAIQADVFSKGDHKSFDRIFGYNLLFQTGGTALVVMILVAFAPRIMKVYGSGFGSGISVLVLLAIGWVMMTVSSVLWDALISSNRIWCGFLFKLIGYAVLLVSAWCFIYLGAKGVAIAYLLSYSCSIMFQGGFHYLQMKAHYWKV